MKTIFLFMLFILFGCANNIKRYQYVEFPHGNQTVTIYDNHLYSYELDWGLSYGYSYGLIERKGDTLLLLPPSHENIYLDSLKTFLNDSTSFTFITNHPKTKIPLVIQLYRNDQKLDGKLIEWNKKYTFALKPKDSLEIKDIDNIFTLILKNPSNRHYTIFYDDYHDGTFLMKDTITFLVDKQKLKRVRNEELTEEIFEQTIKK